MPPARPQKISFVALVLLLALGGVWGGSFFFAEIALREVSPRFDLSIPVWSALLALSVFSTGIAYILYFEILKRAGAANLMLVTLIIPPVAVVLGSVFLGERLGIQAFAGFLLIAIGLAITDGRLFVTVSNRH